MKQPHHHLVKSLSTDTASLATENGRRVGQPGHEIAKQYLLNRMTSLGLVPFSGEKLELGYGRPHPTSRKSQVFSNLVGVIPGKNRKLSPILLGAHYDSVIDAPCADDNATSVALNLAIAEEFSPRELERDLIIALFDAEEPPHFLGETMGSTRFFEDFCDSTHFAGVIVSDLIGHDLSLSDLGIRLPGADLLLPNAKKTVFVLGAESDPAFPKIVEEAAGETKGISVFPTLNSYIGNLSDHHAFEKAGEPFLFLSCAQGKYYHHPKDNLDWINFQKLASITEFTASLIRKIDANPGDRDSGNHDTLDFELRLIKKAIGPTWPILAKSFGISLPKNRREMDQLILSLV